MNIRYRHKKTGKIFSLEEIKECLTNKNTTILLCQNSCKVFDCIESEYWMYDVADIPFLDDFEIIQDVFDTNELRCLLDCIHSINCSNDEVEVLTRKISKMYYERRMLTKEY